MLGDDGYPYGIPLDHWYSGNKLYGQSYFGKCFREKMGSSPREYRFQIRPLQH